MIVQCEECKTRFRMADDKIKPTGTKVRCSKCKHIFTVTLPEEPEVESPVESQPEPQSQVPTEPGSEPQEETADSDEGVDFGDFNMEKVAEQTTAEETTPPEPDEEPPATSEAAETDGLDFSGLAEEMSATAGTGEELADDFSFADTSLPTEEEPAADEESVVTEEDDAFEEEAPAEEVSSGLDFDAAFEESEESEAPTQDELVFEEQPGADEPSGEFSFDSEEATPSPDAETAGEFSFEETEDTQALSFDESASAPEAPEASEDKTADEGFSFDDESGPGEFSFGEDTAAEETTESTDWSEGFEEEGASFDFDEPQFETESPPKKKASDEGGLQFGEIDFAEESGGEESPGFGSDDDFSKASLVKEEEPAPSLAPDMDTPRPRREPREEMEEAPLPAPQKKRKSPLARVLALLVLLVLVLGGAAGYFYMQGGTVDINQIVRQLPFLQPYLGQPEETIEAPRIGINITSSTYVNNRHAGQLLVIQGEAVNNYPGARSAITLKGILLDKQDKILLQQTVFCGNYLGEDKLRTMPFASIEEAMNNQFGDSLSNMNVSAGKAIPFTIVFRNLPDGIANIHVEIVDSKPGQ